MIWKPYPETKGMTATQVKPTGARKYTWCVLLYDQWLASCTQIPEHCMKSSNWIWCALRSKVLLAASVIPKYWINWPWTALNMTFQSADSAAEIPYMSSSSGIYPNKNINETYAFDISMHKPWKGGDVDLGLSMSLKVKSNGAAGLTIWNFLILY